MFSASNLRGTYNACLNIAAGEPTISRASEVIDHAEHNIDRAQSTGMAANQRGGYRDSSTSSDSQHASTRSDSPLSERKPVRSLAACGGSHQSTPRWS